MSTGLVYVRALVCGLLLLIGFFVSAQVSQGLQGSETVKSYGVVRYSEKAQENLYGFACASSDFWYGIWKAEYFDKIKGWGFNCILVEQWWGKLESEGGVYNQARIDAVRNTVTLAKSRGLQVIISLRVCYDPTSRSDWWTDWSGANPTHDYVNLNSDGRNRYTRFLEMMAQKFYDCIICPWHFPYHRQSCDVGSTAWNTYRDLTFPTLLNAVRKHNNNPVVFVPIHQGKSTMAYYRSEKPYNFQNLIYACGHMLDGKVEYGNEWDYNYAEIDAKFEPIKFWRETYDVPIMSVEYAPLTWGSYPLTKSRLDCLEYSLQHMRRNGVGWMYWRISLTSRSGDNILNDVESFEANPAILSRLQTYTGS